MRYMGVYKEEPMASTKRTVKVRYVVVDTRKGSDLVIRHNLKDALRDCDGMSHAHVRREVEIAWENVRVVSQTTIHSAMLPIHNDESYQYCSKHDEWYNTQYWSCCEQCWKERK